MGKTEKKVTKGKKPQTKKTAQNNGGRTAAQSRESKKRSLLYQVLPYLLIVAAVFLLVCFFTGNGEDPGIVNGFIYKTLTGLFSGAAFALPVFLVTAAVSGFRDREEAYSGLRYLLAAASVVLLAALLELIHPGATFVPTELFRRGAVLEGGGVIGGLMGEAFLWCFKAAGSYVLIISLLILSVLLTLGLTPKYLYVYFSYKLKLRRERRAEEKALEADAPIKHFKDPETVLQTAESRQKEEMPPPAPTPAGGRRHKFDTDVPVDGEDEAPAPEKSPEEINREIFDEVIERSRKDRSAAQLEEEEAFFASDEPAGASDSADSAVQAESFQPSAEASELLDRLADAYLGKGTGTDAPKGEAEMRVERKTVSEIPAKAPSQMEIEIPKPEYRFPPISLLCEEDAKRSENIREELHDNAAKLVSVLASFNVKTKIVGVSRGPTITRYELLPEAGTRVRSIANLVDDIALNLATTGVRIEAPIPGKAAVGIEVPNKTAETVYLRTLLENPEFIQSKSKITTALGKNVGGETVIMDIKKMPHLLIAGATGMGKSVCINCLLVSLLYKAKPSEVKLILIDPKKVEFSIYNGLPHLLVPVVSDPKKAAGSLSWAVNEMERRFGLIEAVGVRDIENYNKITENDPDYEYMPQIVIVIDELADLMATAADDVETSIARLAAKARAAGMHLVIGTQRPSVDVITGVIKANIPSRIAFTVASQVDSRTIIDRSGAENLIGRGDMLYNPVGASKPMRVQGAFVSEKEVDSVVCYIKEHNSSEGVAYSDEIMKQIEAEAAMCGVKKGSGAPAGGEGGDNDPLLRSAMEVAFESGKISTSLLQRRLSVGYGRAAKIIDRMEQLGYVSAPDGIKPRQILISKQDYMEMVLKDEDPQ